MSKEPMPNPGQEGPARVVKNQGGFFHVYIDDTELFPSFAFEGEAGTMAIQINAALSARESELSRVAEEMAKALDGFVNFSTVEPINKDEVLIKKIGDIGEAMNKGKAALDSYARLRGKK
jgi:hypothetical protein